MKKKTLFSGINARLALAIVALTGVFLTGCYKDDGLDVNGGLGEIVLPAASYTVNGTIFDAKTGAAITDAKVTVDPSLKTVVTGNSFTSEVSAGEVKITITAENYVTAERTVTIDKIAAGQTVVYPQIFPMLSSTNTPDPSFSAKVDKLTKEETKETTVNESNTTTAPKPYQITYDMKTGSAYDKSVSTIVGEAGFTEAEATEAEKMINQYLATNGYSNTGITTESKEETVNIPANSIYKSYQLVDTEQVDTITFSVYGKTLTLVVTKAEKTSIKSTFVPIDHGHGSGGTAGGGIGN